MKQSNTIINARRIAYSLILVIALSIYPAFSYAGWDATPSTVEFPAAQGMPNMVVDQNGTITAAWVGWANYSAQTATVYASRRIDGQWSAPVQLITPTVTQYYNPQLAVDGHGKVIAVWGTTAQGVIQSSRWDGMQWSAPQTIGSGSDNPVIAINTGGKAIVTWSNGSGRISTAIGDGNNWIVRENVNDELSTYSNTSAFATIDTQDNATVVWSQRTGLTSAYPLNTYASRWDGSNWSPPERIENTGHSYITDVTSDNNGDIFALIRGYTNTNSTNNKLYVNRWTNGAWLGIQQINAIINTENTSLEKIISDNNNNVITLWTDSNTQNLLTSRWDGSSWSSPENISIEGVSGEVRDARLGTDSFGNTTILWRKLNNTGNTVVASSRWSHDAWSTPTVLDINNRADMDFSRLLVSPNGSADAIWVGSETLESSHYTLPTHTITKTASPSAGGEISCTTNLVTDGQASTCAATANTGYTFASWGGDCSGTNPTCTLSNVSTDKTVTANFTPVTAIDTGETTLAISGGLIASATSTLPPAGAPTGVTFPHGMLDFRVISTGSITVTVTYPDTIAAGSAYWKESGGIYTTYPATISGNRVTFTLTDNGAGDDDPTIGVIHDPSGIGQGGTQEIRSSSGGGGSADLLGLLLLTCFVAVRKFLI